MAGQPINVNTNPNTNPTVSPLLQQYIPQGVAATDVYKPRSKEATFMAKIMGFNIPGTAGMNPADAGKTYGDIAKERFLNDMRSLGLYNQQQAFQLPNITIQNPYADGHAQTGNVNQFGRPRYLSNADSPFVGMTNGKPNFQRPQGLLKQEQ